LNQRITLCLCLWFAQSFPVQLAHCFHNDPVEVVGRLARSSGKARAHQSHRKCVTSGYGHRSRIIADQMPQPDAYLGSGMTAVGQHEDAARVLTADTD
jgi:hypothetical protein